MSLPIPECCLGWFLELGLCKEDSCAVHLPFEANGATAVHVHHAMVNAGLELLKVLVCEYL